MSLFANLKLFAIRIPEAGPALFVFAMQYFLVQLLVALKFVSGYSLRRNTISDLGNTHCGTYAHHFICSPLHSLMDVSFVLLGISVLAGSVFYYAQTRKPMRVSIGFKLFAFSGLGIIMVGIFPENTVLPLHEIGAALSFVLGNIALLFIGKDINMNKRLRIYTMLSGTVGLLALVFFSSSHYLGLGEGGIERIVAYPQTLWMIVFGIYFLSPTIKKQV